MFSLFPFEGPLLVGLYWVFFRSSINCFYSSKKNNNNNNINYNKNKNKDKDKDKDKDKNKGKGEENKAKILGHLQ